MKKSNFQKHNKTTDTFGRRGKFGFPIDISSFEGLKPGTSLWYDANKKSRNRDKYCVLRAIFKMCELQGNPQTLLIEKEEEQINEQVKQAILEWLQEAIERLPKNQSICVTLRFWLDNGEPRPKNKNNIRTTKEVGEIVGISQQQAHRTIERGLKNLKRDYKRNLEKKINQIKS